MFSFNVTMKQQQDKHIQQANLLFSLQQKTKSKCDNKYAGIVCVLGNNDGGVPTEQLINDCSSRD